MRKRRSGLVNAGPGLVHACERALARSARSHGVGTRQQVRAAARRFVRGHRRDMNLLTWVLRTVGASSALAVALLGLSPGKAAAELPQFEARTGAANPLNDQNVGSYSTLSLVDLDGDGDLDVSAGAFSGGFGYFKNTGSAVSPAYAPQSGAADPTAFQDVGDHSHPCYADLDGDGDYDLVVGEQDGVFNYYENTGSATTPALILRTGAANPLNGQDVGLFSRPVLGDVDGDADLDLVAGAYDGTFRYFENTGTATIPSFLPQTGAANPFGFDAGVLSAPALVDLDGDGDTDLVAGSSAGTFDTFENTGSATIPAFIARTGAANPLNGVDVGANSTPSLGDLDGDGDPDLLSGKADGFFTYFESFAADFIWRTGAANPLDGLSPGMLSAPAPGDLDADGDLDLVAGEYNGVFRYFQNTGSALAPAFVARTGTANPLNGQDVGARSSPSLGDLDGDGDLDLIAGESTGVFFYFENTGSPASPAFIARTGVANPLNGQDVGAAATPAVRDLDGDGNLDVVAGENDGVFNYFENTGTAVSPSFLLRTGAANPLDGHDLGVRSAPALGDLDGDGDFDVVAGEQDGVFNYFENTGTAASPAFLERTSEANPLAGWDVGTLSLPSIVDLDGNGEREVLSGANDGLFYYFVRASAPQQAFAAAQTNPLDGQSVGAESKPALGDLDRDGDLDLVVGDPYGEFSYYENTGTAISAAFVRRTGAANPLGLQFVFGGAVAPALGDLDGDGDLDVVAGAYYGNFDYFENTGSATNPDFVQRTGAANPLAGQDIGAFATASLSDLDGDGDLDVVAGDFDGELNYFENTVSRTSPAFVERTGGANPFDAVDVGTESTSALGDFDGDGDLDLIAGDSDGDFNYFGNTGSATSPQFVPLTGAANPLTGQSVGNHSAPTSGDLDADGDLDLVTGKSDGMFAAHYFPEPARALLLGAGIALVGWLDRLRRRQSLD